MNVGYVRLSRDDDKRNYVSIENQKLIINQYAANHGMVIDRWYEDCLLYTSRNKYGVGTTLDNYYIMFIPNLNVGRIDFSM